MNLKRMKGFAGKALSLIFMAGVLAGLVACGSNGDTESLGSSSQNGGSAKGRYVEAELPLPDLKDGGITGIYKVGDSLRLVSTSGMFDSADGGKTWSPIEFGTPKLKQIFQDNSFNGVVEVSPEGDMVLAYRLQNQPTKYLLITKDGTETEFDLNLPKDDRFSSFDLHLDDSADSSEPPEETAGSAGAAEVSLDDGESEVSEPEDEPEEDPYAFANTITKFHFLKDGTLVGLDQAGGIYHIDPKDGSFLHTVQSASATDFYTDFACTGSTLIAKTFESVELYDLSTWELKEKDETLTNFLMPNRSSEGGSAVTKSVGSGSGMASISDNAILFAGEEEDAVYICGSNGVYRHILGGSAMEQVINGSLNSLSNPSLHVQSMLKSSDGSFKAQYFMEDGKDGIFDYTYDPNMAAVPEKELKAYSLNDSAELRQAISVYQKAHPDVYINLEIGLTGDDAVTASDALRTLNTNIMAGKGPDVILLDDMPVDSYLEKGLLLDLNDLVKEVSGSEGLFDNIAGAYERDGKLCAIPTRFRIPIVDAKTDLLSGMNDLAGVADTVEKLRKENPDAASITGLDDLEGINNLITRMYAASSPSWKKADGTLDESKLEEFLIQLKRIYDTRTPPAEETGNSDAVTFSYSSSDDSGLDLISGSQLILFGTLSSPSSLATLSSVNKRLGNYEYGLLPGQAQNVFIPTQIVGVSAKSSRPEDAKEFVKFLLSSEAQQIDQGSGIPVNTTAFDALCTQDKDSGGGVAMFDEDGGSVYLQIIWPDEAEFAALKEKISQLSTPSLEDSVISSTVAEEGKPYLEGTADVKTAVDNIMKKVNLYLSE